MKQIVANVPDGTVCRLNGEWGVIVNGRGQIRFDRWHAPAIALRDDEIVDVPKPRSTHRPMPISKL